MLRRIALSSALLAAIALPLTGCGGGSSRSDIAFVSTRDGDYAVFVMAADGKGERRLTDSEPDPSSPTGLFFQIEPAWSPDGSKIAFASRRSGSFDIFVMNADGSGTKQLTSGKRTDNHPTWSPDGKRIAFAGDGDIYVMNADGPDQRRVSDIIADESEPSWSPDGASIAYVRRTPGGPIKEIWVMRPDGSGRHAITSRNAVSVMPAWSPDSTRIVFASNKTGIYELFTIGRDGEGLESLVPTAGDNFEPSWSPDGSKIAYQEGGAIFTVDLGDREFERLTDSENNDSSPVWNPAPAAD